MISTRKINFIQKIILVLAGILFLSAFLSGCSEIRIDTSTGNAMITVDKTELSKEEAIYRLMEQKIAYELANRLSETGLLLDADTVRWAARLQSIGGTDPSGAETGSRILETMGYPDEAFAVLNHIDLFFRSIINEAVVLYLANRQVPDKEVLPFPEVFRRDRECSDSTTEDRIAQDTVIINMINTLYGEDLLPLE